MDASREQDAKDVTRLLDRLSAQLIRLQDNVAKTRQDVADATPAGGSKLASAQKRLEQAQAKLDDGVALSNSQQQDLSPEALSIVQGFLSGSANVGQAKMDAEKTVNEPYQAKLDALTEIAEKQDGFLCLSGKEPKLDFGKPAAPGVGPG